MDEGNSPVDSSPLNGVEEEEDRGLPLASSFRFPSMDGDDRNDEGDDDSDFLPQLMSPPPSLDANPLQEAHPASKLLRRLFGFEFLLMIPVLPLELFMPDGLSVSLILCYSVLLFVHILVALSMFGLLYDPWHNNIVKALKVHQTILGVCSLLLLVLFGYLVFTDSTEDVSQTLLTSHLGQPARSLPYHLSSGILWGITLLVSSWSVLTLTRHKFDISMGTGCCPVIRCRACRVTCFLGLPDAVASARYHQHHGERKWDSEGISINTLHKREPSASKPRTLPLPEDDGDIGPGHFDKRGSVDYFAPIWKSQQHGGVSQSIAPRADIDTPRLSGSAPSEWRLAPPLEMKKKENNYAIMSRSVGNVPFLPHGKDNLLNAPLLDHRDSL